MTARNVETANGVRVVRVPEHVARRIGMTPRKDRQRDKYPDARIVPSIDPPTGGRRGRGK